MGVGVGVASAPTVIVTVAPVERRSPGAGSWLTTRPENSGGAVASCLTLTLKPACSSSFCASSAVGLSVDTSGTSGRSLATVRLTVAPLSTVVPAAGILRRVTVPGSLVDSCSVTFDARPRSFSWDSASSRERPVSFGTATPSRPLDTLRLTVRPLVSSVPGAGDCEITCPFSTVSENSRVTLGLKPALEIASVGLALGQALDRRDGRRSRAPRTRARSRSSPPSRSTPPPGPARPPRRAGPSRTPR